MAKIRRFGLPACLLLVLLVLPFFIVNHQKGGVGNGFTLNLQAPDFVQKAYAGNSEIGQYLDSEAGISAYFQSSIEIDVNQASSACRTIETLTSDYLICSVAVPNYVEHFDTHVYVHKSGWIMAYYSQNEPVSKILDMKARTINTTLFKTVVGKVALAAGVPFTDVTYYDFRYPNATKMLFVAEANSGGNSFTIQAPSSYGYFERSWAVQGGSVNLVIDGVTRPNQIWSGDSIRYGILTASQFLSDVEHAVAVDYYGVLVVVYRELP